jgi:hypothetical protein
MLDQNLPLFVLYSLMMAMREQESTENLIEAIQMQQKRQKIEIINSIEMRTGAQEKKEKLIREEDDWKTKVNVDRTGEARKDDPPPLDPCLKVILVIVIFIVAAWTGGLGLLLIVAVAAITICAIVSQICKAAIKSHAQMRQFEYVMSWLNPAELLADAVVTVVCELGGYNPNDEKMKKLKMGLMLAINILAAIAIIVLGIVVSVLSGGTLAPAIAMAIVGVIMGAIQLACAILEYQQAEKAMEVAEKRLALNKMLAVIEKIKMDLETVSQEIDMLIELFASKMSDVREEYEKASRLLKEYNDTKRLIAQNIRS